MANKIEIWMINPIKYLDKRSLIVFKEFKIFFSLRSGVISTKTLCKSLLSFKKKKVMKRTEKRPILKVPTTPMTEFNKLGIEAMFDVKSIFFNSLNKLILLAEKNTSISWNRLNVRFRNSSVFNKDILCPCSLINGINIETTPEITVRNSTMVITTAKVLGNFNLFLKKLSMGLAIKDKTVAITR